MKKQFLKIAGVKTEDEFYNKYPSEEDFFKAHPEALKQLARGGEAFPQIATMDNFFTYGSPVPPTYYAHGGAFPMAQSEEQFFSPYYGNIPNPYNKAMGGSYDEAHNEAMSFPYGNTGPSTHFMMQDGGYMPENQPTGEEMISAKYPERLADFILKVKETAAKGANKRLREGDDMAKYGKELKIYQNNQSGNQTVPNRYFIPDPNAVGPGNRYGTLADGYSFDPQGNIVDASGNIINMGPQQSTPGAQQQSGQQQSNQQQSGNMNLNDYANMFNMFNTMRNQVMWQPTHTYGFGRGLRDMFPGLTPRGRGNGSIFDTLVELSKEPGADKNPLLKSFMEGNVDITRRRENGLGKFLFGTRTDYRWNQPGSGGVDRYGMPIPGSTNTSGSKSPGTSGTGQDNSRDGMGWLARQFYKPGNKTGADSRNIERVPGTDADPLKFKSRFDPTGYNVDKSEVRNQLMQNRHRRLGDKLDALHTKDLSLKEQGFKGLGEKDKNKLERLQGRMDRIENNRMDAGNTSVSSFQKYTAPFVDRGTPTAMTPKGPTKLSSPRPFNFRDFLNYQDQNALSDAGMAPLNTIQSAPATAAGVNSQAQPPVSVNYPPTTRSTKPVMDFDPFGNNTVPNYTPNSQQNNTAPPASLAPINSNPTGPRNDVDFNTPDFQSAYPPGAAQTGWQKGSSYVPSQSSSNTSSPQSYQQMQNVMNVVSPGAIVPRTYTGPYAEFAKNVIAAQNAESNADAGDSGFPPELLRRQAGPTNYRKGGSYNAGDVVDMTPEEIQRFIEMGGQVEFLD